MPKAELIEVYSKRVARRHLVDNRRFNRVSTSRSLCGQSGTRYWIPLATYYVGQTWPMCKVCQRIARGA